MEEISVHDNFLAGYEVHCEEHWIRIRTEFRDRGEPFEFTEVFFSEVVAYDFKQDLFGSIIFDIEEIPLELLLKKCQAAFDEGRRYGWPRFWEGSLEGARQHLESQGIHAFQLQSSYGMDGWVLAKEMKFIRKD